MRKIACVFVVFLLLLCLSACSSKDIDPQLQVITFYSEALDKDMRINVCLPKEYDGSARYPVLYFLPDYGGGAATVFDVYEAGKAAGQLTEDGKIEPLILVSTNMDQSFGINSSDQVERFETSSGKTFTKGPYEDYIVNDLIPYIDSEYCTLQDRNSRFIGGYSMGGFAALHIAFRHPELFSRVGGHSPSLFTGDFPDTSISDWLYPNEAARIERDPILLAKNRDLSGLSVFIDTGETDVNVEGCQALCKVLESGNIPVEFYLFIGTHSRGYCYSYMSRYLLFYAGINP